MNAEARTELAARLRAAVRHDVPDDVRERHVDAVRAAAAAAPPVSPRTPSWRWRPAVASGLALAVTIPGVAVASQDALPGEALYPVKRATETVRAVVDDDVRARHRLDELERFLDDSAAAGRLLDALEAARVSLAGLDADDPLVARFATLSAAVRTRLGADGAGHDDGDADDAPAVEDPDQRTDGDADDRPDGEPATAPDDAEGGGGEADDTDLEPDTHHDTDGDRTGEVEPEAEADDGAETTEEPTPDHEASEATSEPESEHAESTDLEDPSPEPTDEPTAEPDDPEADPSPSETEHDSETDHLDD